MRLHGMTTVEGPALISHQPNRESPPLGLRPFDHQVAGQSVILRYDEATICKCLTHREYKFYLARPDSLLPFIPQFRGVIQVYLPDPNSHDCPPGCKCSRPHHHHPSPSGVPLGWLPKNPCPPAPDNGPELDLDPVRRRALRKTSRSTDPNSNMYHFMMLEDLMAGYKQPCILDLKMGVRQHGDDATPEKVAYQVNKCKTTTSASLGIRLCGMKKYLATTGDYETLDKNHGRQMSDDELKSQIVNFLSNGEDMRVELIDSILHQLEQLKNVIMQLDSYRFYSCSLLIIYEGDVEEGEGQCDLLEPSGNVTESHIDGDDEDLEDCDSECSESDTSESSNDSEQVFEDVCSTTESMNILSLSSQDGCEGRQPSSNIEDSCSCHSKHNSSSEMENSTVPSSKSTPSRQSNMADVRVVDFAHATFDGFLNDTVKHIGPDHGFLLGLDTLLDVFSDLKVRDGL